LSYFAYCQSSWGLRIECKQPAKTAVAKNVSEPIAGGHEVFMLEFISHSEIGPCLAKLKKDAETARQRKGCFKKIFIYDFINRLQRDWVVN
jgi:hypothetical protein